MEISKDYKDLLKIFNKYKVKYQIVGGYAVIFYTEPRYTKDVDIWIKNNLENAKKVYKALVEFGAPLKGVSINDFTKENMIYQVGVAPVRIDIIMSIPGLNFDKTWNKRKKTKYGGVPVGIISLDELIKSKRAAGRKQDELDLENLLKK